MGSWWAYYELGWGGWWFWDPVENASFLPWLLGTALLHSLAVTEKRGSFKSWTVLLAIVTEGVVEAGIGHVMTVVPSEPTAEPLRLNVKVAGAVVVTLAPIVLLTHFSTERLRVGLG